MLIRCWGARGSISVSGKEYLRYGGSTTCLEIRGDDDELIVVDAGSGIRRLGNKLMAEEQVRCHLIFTHAHWDHVLGFPFFKPVYRPSTQIALYGSPFVQESLKHMVAGTMEAPYFPVPFVAASAHFTYHDFANRPFDIGDVAVTPIYLSHPNRGYGFKFVSGGKTFVFLTDNELAHVHPGGLTFEDYRTFAEGADLLIHDAEYTEGQYKLTRTWGHSTYNDALRLAIEAGVKQFGVFHHNQDRSDDALDDIVSHCREICASRQNPPECFALAEGMEISL